MFFYFKEIRVVGAKHIPKDKPVLFLSNHQNALLDALLIATKCGRFSYFLTRASVFKKFFVSKLLKSLNMLPVYRVRDGWNTITNNNVIFDSCTEILHQKKAVVIFPEGSHNLNRTVRPLSKGFTRIVFDTLEKYPKTDLQLIPVGLNYINAKNFADSTSIYFGKPIEAKSFVLGNRNEDVLNLKKNIQLEISKLTTHIPTENYEETIEKLDALNINYLNPKAVNKCIANNFEDCKQKPKTNLNWLRFLLKGLLILNILPPYLIWKFIAQPKIKEIEFTATFRFAIAITLVPLYLLIICLVLASMFTLTIGLSYFILVITLSLLAVKL
ncbi:1-acyl-sn-glycerol-3-phosphate acyltransferase [bacterium AH-315-P13]|nr:1-acyl-sn-glycerol-3-phosphate acyltransferase [bacterium AH-315-P13]